MAVQTLETGKGKIAQICDELRRGTIEPAEAEAGKIVQDAKNQAAEIVRKAEAEAKEIEQAAHERIEKERKVFESSMAQGIKQSVQTLRQEIEKHLLNDELGRAIAEASGKPDVVAKLVDALVGAIDKEGIETDIEAVIPAATSVDEVAALLKSRAKDRLTQGDMAGGVMIKLVDKQITIDVSDQAVKELLGRYVRKDYREVLFG